MKKDTSKSIKKIMIVYLVILLALISYIVYFTVVSGPKIAAMDSNTRTTAKQNTILRGTIYDSEGNALTESEKTSTLGQTITYPYGSMYANVVGYYSSSYGMTGLEKTYNSELSTYQSGTGILRYFNIIKSFKERSVQKVGNSVYTTLDTDLQKAAYEGLSKYTAGAVVAINAKTGAILASVSYPSFDPNDLAAAMAKSTESGVTPFLIDRATQGLYAPGSTFKVITLASGLENISGLAYKTFDDTGKITIGDYTLPNENGVAYGDIGINKALSVSSNVVFGGIIAEELGNAKLKTTAEEFGFNEDIPTVGFSLKQSTFPTLESYELGNIAQSGIGQGSVQATPTEMALVAATVANNGIMMRPYLVSKVVDSEGNVVDETKVEEYRQVLSSANDAVIKNAMSYVVSQRVQSGTWSYFSGINDVGAKTGTAQTGSGQPNSWWMGYSGDIAVAVVVEGAGNVDGASAKIAASVIKAYQAQQ
ncbi:MAG: penicillin-binding transpeptidase domain-containing protein [Clostridium perfringens]|nr:penicillin-binding transpeptidase domain-containing protein [Clostridium perfringens]